MSLLSGRRTVLLQNGGHIPDSVVEEVIEQLENMLKMTSDPDRSLFSSDEIQNDLLDILNTAYQLKA